MGKDDGTWLNICYLAFAAVVAYFCYKAVGTFGVQFGWLERYDSWFPMAQNISAIVVGGGTALWLRADMDRREYHLAAIGEVRKVTWPTLPATKKMTIIVVIVVAIFAVILAVFDLVWAKVLQLILP